jgi:hypothetical protein
MPIADDGGGLDVTKAASDNLWTYRTPAGLRSPHFLRCDRSTFSLAEGDGHYDCATGVAETGTSGLGLKSRHLWALIWTLIDPVSCVSYVSW